MSMEGPDADGRHRSILPTRLSKDGSPTSTKLGTPSSSSSRVPRRRAPITNVACQECRKRKTKCDGQRPCCANCIKRAHLVCQYDAEGTQSNRLAIYKSRLEKQNDKIQELEAENARLKEATTHHHNSVAPLTLPAPLLQSLSLSPFPQLPPITSYSAAPSWLSSINPLKFPHSGTQIRLVNGQQEVMGFAPSGTMDWTLLEEELSHNQSQKRILQTENNRLKELVVLLTLLDDRDLAKQMALRIQEEGVSDDLLCEANALVASGSVMPIPTHISGTSRTPQLPALSSLELPTISAPYTPDIDPELQARRYPPPPLSFPRADSDPGSRVGWR